jgi:hypothetical protein
MNAMREPIVAKKDVTMPRQKRLEKLLTSGNR